MTTRSMSVYRALTSLVFAILLALPVACEGDKGSDTDTGGGGGGSDTVTGDAAAGDSGGGGPVTNQWKATLQDFQTKANVADASCWLLYNVYYGDDDPSDGCTPDALAGSRVPADQMPAGGTQPLLSGADGELDLPLPSGTYWGFECDKGAGDEYRVAYQYNISANTTAYDGEEIWVIPNGLYKLAPTLAGITQDETQGVVAGRLVWYAADGTEEYVGCATISLEVEDPIDSGTWVAVEDTTSQVRYFADNDLPTTIALRQQSNPINGLFIGANIAVGPNGEPRRVRMTAKMGTTILGIDDIFAAPNSVVINNIEVGRGLCHEKVGDFPANPTPADCR